MVDERLGRTCVFGRHNPTYYDSEAVFCNIPRTIRCHRDEPTTCPYHRTVAEAMAWMEGT